MYVTNPVSYTHLDVYKRQFPKDVKALIKTAEQNGYSMQVLKAVEDVNENQKGILFEKLVKVFKDVYKRQILW